MEYDICLGSEKVGQATVQPQGLYYGIRCFCRLTGAVGFRLLVKGSLGEADLGLLVPMNEGFGVNTRVPIKKVGEELRFSLVPKHRKMDDCFVPLCPDEPFSYLTRLENAFLENREGTLGVVVQGLSSDSSKPTGQ